MCRGGSGLALALGPEPLLDLRTCVTPGPQRSLGFRLTGTSRLYLVGFPPGSACLPLAETLPAAISRNRGPVLFAATACSVFTSSGQPPQEVTRFRQHISSFYSSKPLGANCLHAVQQEVGALAPNREQRDKECLLLHIPL